ncbi:MAG TPA: hypothetical protein VFS47_17570, partial [Steroidobacteraceae bacterium]|nr:hypothetical protein [Steroidobacteraceae bacterium]
IRRSAPYAPYFVIHGTTGVEILSLESGHRSGGAQIMTAERDPDSEPTVKMPLPIPQLDRDLEDIDPEKTLVREDWDKLAPRRAAAPSR